MYSIVVMKEVSIPPWIHGTVPFGEYVRQYWRSDL